MTSNRRHKAEIRARQAATGVPYMVARRQLTGSIPTSVSAGKVAARVDVLPPLSDWIRPRSCQWWAETAEKYGPLIALTISRGDGWWELDDRARKVAGALQDRPMEERGLWIIVGRYTVTKREHLDGIAAALDAAGALSRLTVRAVPDAVRCEHASCRRRRGQAPVLGRVTSRPPSSRPGLTLGPTLSLAEVMERHPQLTSFGIGVYDPRCKTSEQRQAELAEERAVLAGREATVLEIAAWLRENVRPIKTPTVGSYGMKHVVERAIGKYVTNGEFIAAALMAGYAFKHTDGPNVLLGMNARDVKRIDATEQSAR
ncbi:MAG: hypothetical protein ACRDSE_00020 [Pseudonocardiaceae bacterium]